MKEDKLLSTTDLFEILIKEHFLFLEFNFKFNLSKIEKKNHYIYMEYRSNNVFICFSYGPPEYDVNFSFGMIGVGNNNEGSTFNSGDLVLLPDNEVLSSIIFFPGCLQHNLETSIVRLALFVKKHVKIYLEGNIEAYENLDYYRKLNYQNWQRKQEIKIHRDEGLSAWRNKEYIKVKEYFSKIKDNLTPSEKKKLAYAKKQINSKTKKGVSK